MIRVVRDEVFPHFRKLNGGTTFAEYMKDAQLMVLNPRLLVSAVNMVDELPITEGDAKGATIDDFRHVDGASGSFQDRFLVHRRAGEPCPECGRAVRKIVVAGRGTYVCERCQPKPRRQRVA